MTNQIVQQDNATAIESALISGDLSRLSPEHRLAYYKRVTESLGLNPLTKPFDYITLNGKLVLYAKRDATDQLRKINGVSITKIEREKLDGIYTVTAYAIDKSGRQDSSIGAVNVENLKGDALANAFMKAETKAKRRVTLSICGLGMLDETEVETIPDARVYAPPVMTVIQSEPEPQPDLAPTDNGHRPDPTPQPAVAAYDKPLPVLIMEAGYAKTLAEAAAIINFMPKDKRGDKPTALKLAGEYHERRASGMPTEDAKAAMGW